MTTHKIDLLPVAVRVYPERREQKNPERGNVKPKSQKPLKKWRRPGAMLVTDTECRVAPTQQLTFGSYRFIVKGECLEEGLFHADDITSEERRILQEYVTLHRAETADARQKLKLLTRAEFLDRLYKLVYKGRCLLVGFNLPFDLSRIAFDVASARGRFAGGFSLGLWSYIKDGVEARDRHRPRVGIKHIDSKRALKGFTARHSPDSVDLIPEGSETGEPERGYCFRGHLLELRTLAFALTNESHTLESACKALGVEHGKQHVEKHGIITEAYIDYNRRDVLATSELAEKLLEEFDKHELELQVTKAYSPASMGKAQLRLMKIQPILKRQPAFEKRFLGFAQSAFFGGRASAHIRKVPDPVVYVDFLSMYTTVNSLMGLWQFVTARKIKVVENCACEIQQFLNSIKATDLFDPASWPKLTAFVKLVPNGDVLPSRAKYAPTNDWQIGVNHLYAGDEGDQRSGALWYSLPDVVASVILTGKAPTIVDAFRLVPVGKQPGILSSRLRGEIEIDPGQQDFFKAVIEERKSLPRRSDLTPEAKKTLDKALKVLASATSYGIYAEMNRQESDEDVPMRCHGLDAEPFECRVSHPDDPGEYCFPPLAALITGAARLMLTLLENCVTELGGTYAMEDTDSMAIVATEQGGLIASSGKRVKALSWMQVNEIVERFSALNPYARDAVGGSILKIEADNFDPATGEKIQLHCLAISAKRYALFRKDEQGNPELIKWSEHGLGHLLNPTNPENADRDWIRQVWLDIVRRALGLSGRRPDFADLPAVGRVSISSPAVMKSFRDFNKGKPYPDQMKPFNFILTCQVKPSGHPVGTDPTRFHLIAPYTPDSRQWLKIKWVDQYGGARYRITTTDAHGDRRTARVRTYGEVLREYEFHPESKCADAEGNACDRQTVGLLQRRHVRIQQIKYIGKESNAIEDVESGMITSPDAVYTEYPDASRDEWQTVILPILRKIPLAALAKTGLSRRALIDMRAGRSRPHPKNQSLLKSALSDNGTRSRPEGAGK